MNSKTQQHIIDAPGLVSIIMPVYNIENYIAEAIQSVIQQSYKHWELIIINDGSTDNTENKILTFLHGTVKDRIQYYSQTNKGVSAARNLGIEKAQGEFICFLDGDDLFTENSLLKRIEVFKQFPKVDFVDGSISVQNETLDQTFYIRNPTYEGPPLKDLLLLTGHSFLGPTWLIKRSTISNFRFNQELSHGEDLMFYISIADGHYYSYCDYVIMIYRKRSGSAMSKIKPLLNFYSYYLVYVKENYEGTLLSKNEYKNIKKKVKRIAIRSTLKKGFFLKTVKWIFK